MLSQTRARVALLLALGGTALAPAHSQSGGGLLRQANYPGMFNKNMSFPVVANGYIVTFSRDSGPEQPNLFLFTALNSGKQQRLRLSLENERARVEDAVVTAGGHILLAGSYVRDSDGSAANFFADVDAAGKVARDTDLGSFTPGRICASDDGTVWVLGQAGGGADDNLLRAYRNGILQGSYLSRASLPAGDFDLRHRGATPAFLSCGISSVGVYLGTPKEGHWTEVTRGSASTWTAPAVNRSRITGLALFGPGKVYASMVSDGGVRGLYQLALGASGAANWQPAGGPAGLARLLGRDDNALVYFSIQGPVDNPVLYWSKP